MLLYIWTDMWFVSTIFENVNVNHFTNWLCPAGQYANTYELLHYSISSFIEYKNKFSEKSISSNIFVFILNQRYNMSQRIDLKLFSKPCISGSLNSRCAASSLLNLIVVWVQLWRSKRLIRLANNRTHNPNRVLPVLLNQLVTEQMVQQVAKFLVIH